MFGVIHNSQFSHVSLKSSNFLLYIWKMGKYPQFVIFLVKSNRKFLKKFLAVHYKKEKKLKICIVIFVNAFVIIVISLDLTEKVKDLKVFSYFSNIEGEIN